MDNPADYDTDILLWSEKQAQVIRAMAGRVRDLPNELDIENVAEEIESVGRSELAATKGQIRQMFAHMIKMACTSPDAFPQDHWFSEAIAFHTNTFDHLTPSMPRKIDVERGWRLAIMDARRAFYEHNRQLPKTPANCPFTLAVVLSERFDLGAAVAIVRAEIDLLHSHSDQEAGAKSDG